MQAQAPGLHLLPGHLAPAHGQETLAEILSRTTRSEDLVTKCRKYAAAGAPWYWIVDPDGPEVVVLRNDGGAFVEVQCVGGGQREPAVGPFPAPLDPGALFA